MVAPLAAAAARGATKGAVKGAAKGAAKGARAPKAGDISTNARKRYYRASERYLKKAEESTGATSKRYRQLAKQNFDDALATYDPKNTQKYSKPIQRLANEFGYDLEKKRELSTDGSYAERQLQQREMRQKRAIADSANALDSRLQDEDFRREREAQTLFRSSEIGRRILGGYVEVWREEATVTDPMTGETHIDTSKVFQSLYKHFGVDNLADLVEKVEDEIGETLYDMDNPEEIYETVKLKIQSKTLDNVA